MTSLDGLKSSDGAIHTPVEPLQMRRSVGRSFWKLFLNFANRAKTHDIQAVAVGARQVARRQNLEVFLNFEFRAHLQ